LVEATDVIMGAIAELLATLRGEEPPAERWDPAAHNQSKHGRFESRGASTVETPDRNGTDEKK
jgi:1-acyl-sn-glycerol-3-phosphate acyltransferase